MANLMMNNYLNIDYINQLIEMDNVETFSELIEISRELLPQFVEELNIHVNTGKNVTEVRTIIHKMKGSASTVGAEKVANMAEELQKKMQKPNYDLSLDIEKFRRLTSESITQLLQVT